MTLKTFEIELNEDLGIHATTLFTSILNLDYDACLFNDDLNIGLYCKEFHHFILKEGEGCLISCRDDGHHYYITTDAPYDIIKTFLQNKPDYILIYDERMEEWTGKFIDDSESKMEALRFIKNKSVIYLDERIKKFKIGYNTLPGSSIMSKKIKLLTHFKTL